MVICAREHSCITEHSPSHSAVSVSPALHELAALSAWPRGGLPLQWT